jgi:hypothetical protein
VLRVPSYPGSRLQLGFSTKRIHPSLPTREFRHNPDELAKWRWGSRTPDLCVANTVKQMKLTDVTYPIAEGYRIHLCSGPHRILGRLSGAPFWGLLRHRLPQPNLRIETAKLTGLAGGLTGLRLVQLRRLSARQPSSYHSREPLDGVRGLR